MAPRARAGQAEEPDRPRHTDEADDAADADHQQQRGLGVQELEVLRAQGGQLADLAGLGGAHKRLEAAGRRHVLAQQLVADVEDDQPDRREQRGDCGAWTVALLPGELRVGVHRGHSSGGSRLGKTRPCGRLGPDLVAPDDPRRAIAGVQDDVQDGRCDADQRLDPAQPGELGGTAVSHGRAIVDSPACWFGRS